MKNYYYEKMNMMDIMNVLNRNNLCMLGVVVDNKPYVIPMYYTIDNESDDLIIKMVSQNEGHKMHGLKNNNAVSIEFQRATLSGMETVIAEGIAKINEASCDLSTITICVDEITGRRYTCHW